MGIATELLALRRNHFSSIASLYAALERLDEAPPDKLPARMFKLDEAADLALTNIAAYAAEALAEPQLAPRRTRRTPASRRNSHRFDSAHSPQQRRLFIT